MSELEIEELLESPEGAVEDEGPMSATDFQSVVQAAVKDASDYIDQDVAPDREKALRYYQGQPLGNEEEGRSRIVMTEVRDTIQAMLPSLLRVFTSSETPVEFVPRSAEKVDQAEQATDYVSAVFMVDNPGFSILQTGFKDALISKIGVFKWHTATRTSVRVEEYTGLDQGMVNVLASAPGVEVMGMTPETDGAAQLDPNTGMPAPPFFTVTIRRKVDSRRQVVECIPPEEFIISRNARGIDDADFVGHRSLKTLSELVEMGFDAEEIEEHGTSTSSLMFNNEAIARNPDLDLLTGRVNDSSDDAMQRYLYIEGYIRADKDGDDIAELIRVCALNDDCHILHDEVVDEVKLAVICPDPEPHQVIGSSIADQVMDLQELKTNVVRNMLDSLAQTIHPRTVIVEGQVNIDDVLNVETGAIIRATQPGMVQSLAEPFVGQAAMPIIAWLDDVRAARTGISKASQGLDPDVLQSTTKAAVTATMSAAQERLEMVARIFAETGIKRLFRGLLKEVVENQDQPRMMRLRNQWVPVDPRSWDVDMDVIVNVGIGNGSSQAKEMLLEACIGKMEQIMQTLGPANPIVDIKQYRDALVKRLELGGIKDGARYFKEVTPEALQQSQQPPQQPADPAQMLAEVEAKKIQKDIEIAQMKAQLEVQKQKDEMDLEHDKLDADIFLRAAEIQGKYGAQLQVEQIYAMIQRDRDEKKLALEHERAQQQQQQQAQLAERQQEQQGEIARQQLAMKHEQARAALQQKAQQARPGVQ
jgi:hypothetical protein